MFVIMEVIEGVSARPVAIRENEEIATACCVAYANRRAAMQDDCVEVLELGARFAPEATLYSAVEVLDTDGK